MRYALLLLFVSVVGCGKKEPEKVVVQMEMPDPTKFAERMKEAQKEREAKQAEKLANAPAVPTFRGMTLGSPFTASPDMKRQSAEGAKVEYTHEIDEENLKGFASYVVIDGNLESVSMIVDHPDMQTLIGIYRDKLGVEPDIDMATRKAWNLKGGKMLIDRKAFVIHTDKFDKYEDEQQKQKQNKSASSL